MNIQTTLEIIFIGQFIFDAHVGTSWNQLIGYDHRFIEILEMKFEIHRWKF